jgi:hypothetical protein
MAGSCQAEMARCDLWPSAREALMSGGTIRSDMSA